MNIRLSEQTKLTGWLGKMLLRVVSMCIYMVKLPPLELSLEKVVHHGHKYIPVVNAIRQVIISGGNATFPQLVPGLSQPRVGKF